MRASVSEKILNVASGLFQREGIRTVGVERIIGEASIAKATFYRHFPSKEDLVLAYLNDRHDRVIQGLDQVRADHAQPRRQIEVMFDRLHEKAENPEFRGCAFALAVAEHGDSPRIVALARFHKQAVLEHLTRIAKAAAIADVAGAATHLALLYDGALARRAVSGDASAMLDAKNCALSVFDRAAPCQTVKAN